MRMVETFKMRYHSLMIKKLLSEVIIDKILINLLLFSCFIITLFTFIPVKLIGKNYLLIFSAISVLSSFSVAIGFLVFWL